MSVDGAGSGIDADLLDGLEASQVIAAAGGDSRTPISSIPFVITEPGSYYMIGNLTNSTANSNGITIDADNVSLDLGGFTLSSPYDRSISPLPTRTGGDGIKISGDNDHIFNGHDYGWGGTGIRGFSANNSIFEKLTVTYNAADGLVADTGAVISHVTASFNGVFGIRGDEGTVIAFSTVIGNGNNGIDVEKGSVVTNSIASNNSIDGFDIAEGSIVQMSTAYDNNREGFYVSSSIVRNNTASHNDGNGFRVYSNSWIINNKAHENNLAGIRISSSDCLVEGNSITDNDQGGLVVAHAGNLIINNKAAGNIYYPDDGNGPYHPHFEIATGNSYGPIVDVNGVGDLSAVVNADHPLANFVY
jgi:parallel beta-helix repeat protein